MGNQTPKFLDENLSTRLSSNIPDLKQPPIKNIGYDKNRPYQLNNKPITEIFHSGMSNYIYLLFGIINSNNKKFHFP